MLRRGIVAASLELLLHLPPYPDKTATCIRTPRYCTSPRATPANATFKVSPEPNNSPTELQGARRVSIQMAESCRRCIITARIKRLPQQPSDGRSALDSPQLNAVRDVKRKIQVYMWTSGDEWEFNGKSVCFLIFSRFMIQIIQLLHWL